LIDHYIGFYIYCQNEKIFIQIEQKEIIFGKINIIFKELFFIDIYLSKGAKQWKIKN
jgi:protein-disulfide isomerase